MDKVKYFKTLRVVAFFVELHFDSLLSLCSNPYQCDTSNKTPKVVKTNNGYRVQYGDFGKYMTVKEYEFLVD